MNNAFEIRLQENIPLSNEDIAYIESEKKVFDTAWIIPVVVTLFSIIIMASKKTQDDVFFTVVLIVFAASYLPIWLILKHHKANFEKDKRYGKNKLTTVVLHSYEEENGHCFVTFAGQDQKYEITLKVEDSHRYPAGTKVMVTYLKFSREALKVVKIEGDRHG